MSGDIQRFEVRGTGAKPWILAEGRSAGLPGRNVARSVAGLLAAVVWLAGTSVAQDFPGSVRQVSGDNVVSATNSGEGLSGVEFFEAAPFADESELIVEPAGGFFLEEPVIREVNHSELSQPANGVGDKLDSPNESAMKALDGCNEGYAKNYQEFFHPISALTASMKTPLGPDQSPQESAELVAPPNCARDYFVAFGTVDATQRTWADLTPLGMPFIFCHRPLYFEDANLERCGYGCCCLQPLVSGAHFFGTVPILPYKMAQQCPCECVQSLGRCPEGCRWSCCENYLPPFDLHAAAVEAAFVTGLVFVIP